LRAKRQEYETARAALNPRLTQASTSQYEALAELDLQIADLTKRMEDAAAAQDFEQALQLVNELSTKVDEKLKRVADLEAPREPESP
jgi:excinuclease UvrABC helicase subunit UvrB